MKVNGAEAKESARMVGRSARARKVISGVLLAVAGLAPLLLTACGGPSVAGAGLAKSQVFTWPYVGKSRVNYGEMLDPASLSYAIDSSTVSMLFVGLVSLDSNLKVQADAAQALPDIDKTGTIYTFHLRPNMKFSDGAPLTAKDFAYSINRALDPTLCSALDANTYGPNAPTDAGAFTDCSNVGEGYLGHILGAEAKLATDSGSGPSLIGNGNDPSKGLNVLDPLTLQIRLDAPVSFFLEALTYPTSFAIEQAFVEKPEWAGGKWVDHLDQGGCSGPFKVQSYGGGKQLTMVPNQAWSDAWSKQLTIQQVVRPVILAQDDAYDAYRKGQFDYVTVPGKNYSTARGQGDFHEVPTLVTRYFGINWNKAPFDNLQVRQAFALALNKQLLVDRILNGGATPTNHMVPRGMPGYFSTLKNPPPDGTQSLTGNQVAAKDLLKKAQATCPQVVSNFDQTHAYCKYITGSTLKEIQINFGNNSQTNGDVSSAAAAQWSAALGLNVIAVGIDPGTLGRNLKSSTNPMQAWNRGWLADYPDPQDWLSLFFKTGAAYNNFGISDPTVDKNLTEADQEQDFTKRMAGYNTVEQQVIDSVALIPFEQDKFYWRQRDWVQGFTLNALQTIADTTWPNVRITDH